MDSMLGFYQYKHPKSAQSVITGPVMDTHK